MIRPFSLSDLNAILKIERESFPKSPYDRMTFIHLHSLYPEHFLVYTGATDGEEDRIWGYIIFSPEGHIISLAILPPQRRKGIGRELLQKAMETPHLKRLQAEVRRSNLGAQTFYSHMGFRIVGVVPNYYGNEDALIIQWTPSVRKSH
ncbi:MAG: GNAT family N-acetyltransferase [Thermodesulfobacteriota bacterium]|nr:GNAT family N-acetyltransferase [Thermodesulfobacteriota bacterium]